MICSICLDNVPLLKGKCGHEFCQSCLDAFIKDAIENRFKVINCPSCTYIYTLEDIGFLSPKNLEQYAQKRSLCVDCHQQNCRCSGRRCPQCHIQIEKLSGCNHMTCRCKYEFCWLCQSEFSIYHYRLWNIIGCPIPGGMMSTLQPLKYPNLLRIVMVLPKILALVTILTFILMVYPIFCFYNTILFHLNLCKKNSKDAIWVLLFPFTYLIELFWKGPPKVRERLQKIR